VKFFTVTQLSPHKALTPEGFLLCRDVPIARTGFQIYGPDESPIPSRTGDPVKVMREPGEVFAPQAIASANGKDVVIDHPDDDVTPENWRELTVGVAMDPHRGTGEDEGVLLVDLLIKDPAAIAMIQDGPVEVSCGYDAEYEETGPGTGRQHSIIINHIALVDQGRCGPRCAIRDHAHPERTTMAKTSFKDRLFKRVMDAFKARDEEKMKEAVEDFVSAGPFEEGTSGAEGGDETDGEHTHIHVHLPGGKSAASEGADSMSRDDENGGAELPPWFKEHVASNNARFDKLEKLIAGMGNRGAAAEDEMDPAELEEMSAEDRQHRDALPEGERAEYDRRWKASRDRRNRDEMGNENREIEGNLEEEAPPGTGDRARKARDSAYLGDSYSDTIALSEIIAPGVNLPTFDRALTPKESLTRLHQFRVRVLDLAYASPSDRLLIEEANGGREVDVRKLSIRDTRNLFRTVGALKRRMNNDGLRSHNPGAGAPAGGGLGQVGPVKTIQDLQKSLDKAYKRA
jgi:hypothetical protein